MICHCPSEPQPTVLEGVTRGRASLNRCLSLTRNCLGSCKSFQSHRHSILPAFSSVDKRILRCAVIPRILRGIKICPRTFRRDAADIHSYRHVPDETLTTRPHSHIVLLLILTPSTFRNLVPIHLLSFSLPTRDTMGRLPLSSTRHLCRPRESSSPAVFRNQRKFNISIPGHTARHLSSTPNSKLKSYMDQTNRKPASPLFAA